MKMRSLYTTAALLAVSTSSFATPVSLDFWGNDGWTEIASENQVGSGNYKLTPGWGGQKFDAEYLFYKLDGSILSLGLQTGFDVVDGHVLYGNHNYYSGDLAVSLDGVAGYEFSVDFGLLTKGYYGNKIDMGTGTGVDAAGLYSVTNWDNSIYYTQSGPFAIDNGTLAASLISNDAGFVNKSGVEYDSFYRTVSFDLADLGLSGQNFELDISWTMSCGNDQISGGDSVTVPEPSSYALLAFGLAGLGLMRVRKK